MDAWSFFPEADQRYSFGPHSGLYKKFLCESSLAVIVSNVPTLAEIYWTLLQPSTLLFVLLVVSLFFLLLGWFRLGRGLLFLLLLVAVIPALLPITDYLALPLEEYFPRVTNLPPQVDGVIVLGGSVEWAVTRARGQLNLNAAGERMLAAAALMRRYPEAEVFFTGIYGEVLQGEFADNERAPGFFADESFARGRITFLGAARSTYEDALLTLEAASLGPGETWLLVTSALHMPRAVGVFRALGWRVTPYLVDYRTTGELELGPTLNVLQELTELDRVVREWGALYIYEQQGRTNRLLPAR